MSDQNGTVPSIMIKLFDIVDEVRKKYKLNKYKIQKRQSRWEYAFHILDESDNYLLYFGIWYRFWREHGKPLCFGVSSYYPKSDGRDIVGKFKNDFNSKVRDMTADNNAWVLSWIDEETLGKEDVVIEIEKVLSESLKKLWG